jgi:hypothetical protein
MKEVASSRDVSRYTCHAGLMETILPIVYEDVVIAYLQIGQFKDAAREYSSEERALECAERYGFDVEELRNRYAGLETVSEEKLASVCSILEILIKSFWEEGLITYKRSMLSVRIESYIAENLGANIYVSELCERFRLSKWRRTGIIWWNLIDGWPQFSDAVVDYYGVKKLAYSYIKRSQEPVCMMFDEPKDNMLPLILCSEGVASEVKYKVTNLTESKTVAEGTATADADASVRVELIPIKEGEKNFYLIEWEISGVCYTNHYVTNVRDLDYKEYLSYLEKCGYDCFEGF